MVDFPKRYEPIRTLGAGGMGRVELVRDRERGQDVALKTFAGSGDEGRFLFKQEFWAMASLRHPNLVEAYDYGELPDATPYFTMEEVAGADLVPPQSEEDVRAWLPGIAAALGFLHGRGWVHGDLKPENIRPPKLMDLGLMERAGRAGGAIRGTPSYMAPEVIRQGVLDARTDLYSLGAVLYHLLAGRPPFQAEQPLALLRAHLMDRPAPLANVSPAMAAAVQKLLAKEPSARFPSAAELMRALGLAATEEGAQLLAPPVVGRAAQQIALADLVAWQGPAHRVLAGPAGSGKTRLLGDLRAEAQLAGVRVLAARGLGPEAAPYEALLPWLRGMAAQSGPDRLAPVLIKVLPELPVLWGLADVAPAPALEGAQERRRLEAAVAELATAGVGDALWLLDDADRLDPASRSLVEALRRAGGERSWRWVEAVAEPPAGEPAIVLPALTPAETLEVARGLLGQADVPAALAERLPALADGIPGTIEALLAHWVRAGDLQGTTGRWEANPAADFALPGGLGVLSDARLDALSSQARHVAQAAALLGDEGELPLLARLAGLPEEAFYGALAELEAADVLSTGDPARYRFEAGAERGFSALARRLAAAVPPEEAARLHLEAARLLARDEGPDAARPLARALAIAQHRLAARQDAGPWVLAAARRALGLGEVGRAAGLLQRAAAQGEEDLAVRRLLADAWRYDGRIDEALALVAGEIVPSLRVAEDPALAHELATLGLLHQLQGRYDEARAAFEQAVAMADERGDVATAVRARTSLGRVAFFGGDAAAARELLARATADARAAGLLTQLAGALGLYGYLIGATDARRVDEALAVLDEAVAANQAIGDAVEELEALNLRGTLLMASGRLAEAEAAFAGGLAVSQRLGLANEEVFAHLNLGAVALERGVPAVARLHGREAAASAERQGRKFPLSFGRAVEGLARVLEGELAAGQALLAEGLELAREINNRYVELAIQAFTAEALVELGRFAEAERALDAARELATATGNDEQQARLARVGLALAALTDAPDAEALLATVDQPAHAARWRAFWLLGQGRLAEAAGAAREAVALAEDAGLDLVAAAARLVEGRVALAMGDEDAAQQAFEAGLSLAEDVGHRALALALRQAAEPSGEAAAELAALAAGLEPGHELAFMQHPERSVVAGPTGRVRQLAGLQASVSAEGGLAEVMHRAIAALVALADADRGFLFLYDGTRFTDQVFYGMAENEADAYSGSLAFKALWSETPIWVEDALADAELGGSLSVQALSLRSALGVPLIEGGRAIGVMLADSQRVNTKFGPQDLELVEVLAGHVALAIGQARRVEQLEREKAELAVFARTAEALLSQRDFEAAFEVVAAEALALTGAERALLLWGPELEVKACHGPAGAPSASAARWVLEQGEPLHLLDASSDEAFQSALSIQALGLRTIVAVPVGDRRGVLYLDDKRITDRDEHVLATLTRLGSLLDAFMRNR